MPVSGEDLRQRWVEELRELGFVAPTRVDGRVIGVRPGALDRDALVETALTRLGSRRSAWNPADARGEVEKLIASAGLVVDAAVRRELAEDLAARVIDASRPLLGRDDVPEHVRALTSSEVLAVEREIVDRIVRRAAAKTLTSRRRSRGCRARRAAGRDAKPGRVAAGGGCWS